MGFLCFGVPLLWGFFGVAFLQGPIGVFLGSLCFGVSLGSLWGHFLSGSHWGLFRVPLLWGPFPLGSLWGPFGVPFLLGSLSFGVPLGSLSFWVSLGSLLGSLSFWGPFGVAFLPALFGVPLGSLWDLFRVSLLSCSQHSTHIPYSSPNPAAAVMGPEMGCGGAGGVMGSEAVSSLRHQWGHKSFGGGGGKEKGPTIHGRFFPRRLPLPCPIKGPHPTA